VEDLYKWNEALFNGKVLSKESFAAALTPVVLNNGKKPDVATYGYGVMLNNYRGQPIVEHGGGLHGFISHLARYPQENLTVVLLTNITPSDVNVNSNAVVEFALWEKMEKQKSPIVSAVTEDIQKYVGRYDFQGIGVMMITAEGRNLFAQLTGQPKAQIFPAGDGEYFWKVVNAKIKFVSNDKGEVEYGNFEQNGYKLRVPKLKEEQIIDIDKALYSMYTGKYDYGQFVITISTEDGKLYAIAPNQPRYEILPVSEKEFVVRELNARLIFVPGEDGKVTKFILDMAGQRRDVVRIE